MQNIEIKARYDNLERGQELARAVGASYEGKLHQIDTYFNVRAGRLKLREINGTDSQLISYERPDLAEVKISHYQICMLQEPGQMKAVLQQALGIWKIVEKQRDLFLHEEVRIHLDQVKDLGNFIEFEGVVFDPKKRLQIRAKVNALVSHFQIASGDLIEGSYSDLFET